MATQPNDQLTETSSPTGTFILNRGDPAFSTATTPEAITSEAESLFANIIAYLLFSEQIVIPSRYIVDGPVMAQVAYWSQPLLSAGLIIPERRGGVNSFLEVAEARGVNEVGKSRARFLDNLDASVRSFRFEALSAQYLKLLQDDLGLDGAFRRLVPGARRGKLAPGLDRAYLAYAAHLDDVTPEHFASIIGRSEPSLKPLALRWAMARYYSTPMLFDTSNTRELPQAAAALLSRSGALDSGRHYFADPAPVEFAVGRIAELRVDVPNLEIRTNAAKYCDALMEVRQRTGWARRLFMSYRDESSLRSASETLTEDLKAELRRQRGVRQVSGAKFVLASSVASGAAGFAATAEIGGDLLTQAAVSVVAAAATGFGVSRIDPLVANIRARKSSPWVVAVDQMSIVLKGQ